MVINSFGLGTFGAVLAFFHLSEFTLAAIFQRAELGWHCKDLDSNSGIKPCILYPSTVRWQLIQDVGVDHMQVHACTCSFSCGSAT